MEGRQRAPRAPAHNLSPPTDPAGGAGAGSGYRAPASCPPARARAHTPARTGTCGVGNRTESPATPRQPPPRPGGGAARSRAGSHERPNPGPDPRATRTPGQDTARGGRGREGRSAPSPTRNDATGRSGGQARNGARPHGPGERDETHRAVGPRSRQAKTGGGGGGGGDRGAPVGGPGVRGAGPRTRSPSRATHGVFTARGLTRAQRRSRGTQKGKTSLRRTHGATAPATTRTHRNAHAPQHVDPRPRGHTAPDRRTDTLPPNTAGCRERPSPETPHPTVAIGGTDEGRGVAATQPGIRAISAPGRVRRQTRPEKAASAEAARACQRRQGGRGRSIHRKGPVGTKARGGGLAARPGPHWEITGAGSHRPMHEGGPTPPRAPADFEATPCGPTPLPGARKPSSLTRHPLQQRGGGCRPRCPIYPSSPSVLGPTPGTHTSQGNGSRTRRPDPVVPAKQHTAGCSSGRGGGGQTAARGGAEAGWARGRGSGTSRPPHTHHHHLFSPSSCSPNPPGAGRPAQARGTLPPTPKGKARAAVGKERPHAASHPHRRWEVAPADSLTPRRGGSAHAQR